MEELIHTLLNLVPNVLREQQGRVGLVVLDSISGVFQGEFEVSKEESIRRADFIISIAKQMKILSSHFRLPFIVTNHVRPMVHAFQYGFHGRSSSFFPFALRAQRSRRTSHIIRPRGRLAVPVLEEKRQ